MANNYSMASFEFNLDSAALAARFMAVADVLGEALNEGDAAVITESDLSDAEKDALVSAFKHLLDFGCLDGTCSCEGDNIWIRHDESINVEAWAQLIGAFMKCHDLPGAVEIECSWMCDKPRVGQFGGAACVVTKDDEHWFNTGSFISDVTEGLALRTDEVLAGAEAADLAAFFTENPAMLAAFKKHLNYKTTTAS